MLTASSRDTLAVGLKRVADIFWSTSVVKKDTDDDIFLNALRTTKCSVKTTNICKRAAPLLLTTSPCITRSAGVTCCLVVMVQEASIRKPLNTSTFCCFVKIPSKNFFRTIYYYKFELYSILFYMIYTGLVSLPSRRLCVWTRTGFAFIISSSTWVTKVARLAFVTLRSFCVMLTTLPHDIYTLVSGVQ